jgi:hypothetical protein
MVARLVDLGHPTVDHEMVKVFSTKQAHTVYIKMQEGGWVKHHPFPPDLRGLVGAMGIATDVMAGKFWPEAVVASLDEGEPRRAPEPLLIPDAVPSDIPNIDKELLRLKAELAKYEDKSPNHPHVQTITARIRDLNSRRRAIAVLPEAEDP